MRRIYWCAATSWHHQLEGGRWKVDRKWLPQSSVPSATANVKNETKEYEFSVESWERKVNLSFFVIHSPRVGMKEEVGNSALAFYLSLDTWLISLRSETQEYHVISRLLDLFFLTERNPTLTSTWPREVWDKVIVVFWEINIDPAHSAQFTVPL